MRRNSDDFRSEIEAHIRIEADRDRERGLSEDDALAAARRAFGNVTNVEERFFESKRLLWWDNLTQDVRICLRLLAKTPAWTVVAVLTVALGIGATAAIFSVVNAALLRPLPFPKPNQLYAVVETIKFGQKGLAPDYFTMRENLHGSYGSSIQEMAAYDSAGVNWTGEDRAERFVAGAVTASFFPILQVQPLYGRTFLPEEDRPDVEKVTVLSYSLWQRRFGGDPSIVGRRIRLDRSPSLVVGIMPPSFDFPKGSELWVPLAMNEVEQRQRKNMAIVGILARSSATATATQVNLELEALMGVVRNEYPQGPNVRGFAKDFVQSLRASATPLQERLIGNDRPAILVFSGAVALMLLIVCLTVANLMLARATAKRREVAVRMALGSPRRRIVRQLLTESLLVSLSGGVLGLAAAWAAVAGWTPVLQKVLPALPAVSVDLGTALFTLAVTVFTGLVFGIAPSFGVGFDVREALLGESRSATTRFGVRRLRQALVVAQLGLSLTLLIGAVLLAKSFYRMRSTDPGFRPENLLTARIGLAGPGYGNVDRQRDFVRDLLERTTALPGVESAGIGGLPPLLSGNSMIFRIENQPVLSRGSDAPRTGLIDASPDYFRALGVPLIQGRQLSAADRPDTPLVVVVNDTFARQFFPGQNPVEHRVSTNPLDENDPKWAEIVGVVGSIHQSGLDQDPSPILYRSYLQETLPVVSRTNLLIRTRDNPALLIPAVRRVVSSMDRDQPIFDVKTMEDRLADSMVSRRFDAALTGTFAAIAIFLASIGVYGVMSYLVTLRTSEFGIRLALGAQRTGLLVSIVREGMSLAFIGVVLGVAGALALNRYLATLLYGVGMHDLTAFVAAIITLVGVVIAACAIPGRRASRVDPATALRHD
jgi:putative ABC transport system permease protein